jgi:hypothetical protein
VLVVFQGIDTLINRLLSKGQGFCAIGMRHSQQDLRSFQTYLHTSMRQGKKEKSLRLTHCLRLTLDLDSRLIVIAKLGDQHPAALNHVLLFDSIENVFALLAAAHQAHIPENAQVMRYGGLRHRKRLRQVADSPFSLKEQLQNPLASIIGQGFAKGHAVDFD